MNATVQLAVQLRRAGTRTGVYGQLNDDEYRPHRCLELLASSTQTARKNAAPLSLKFDSGVETIWSALV
jgi:hypothetical protein